MKVMMTSAAIVRPETMNRAAGPLSPSMVPGMETSIWPDFLNESMSSGMSRPKPMRTITPSREPM